MARAGRLGRDRRGVRSDFLAVFVVIAGLSHGVWSGQRARARDPDAGADATRARRLVLLEIERSLRSEAEFEATVRELLARLGLEVVRSEREGRGTVVAFVRVEAAGRGALVVVSDGQGRVTRREVAPAATRTLFRETLAHVILGAVEPLARRGTASASEGANSGLAYGAAGGARGEPAPGAADERGGGSQTSSGGPDGGAERVAANVAVSTAVSTPASTPAPARREVSGRPNEERADPRPAEPDSTLAADAARERARSGQAAWSFSLGARGAGVMVAAERLSGRFGGSAALTFPARLAPALVLDAGYTVPLHIERRGVRADFSLTSARAQARIEPYRGARWALRIAVGGGIDVVSMAPVWTAPDLRRAASTRRVHPILSAAVGARFDARARLAVTFDLGLDVDGAPATWNVALDDERSAPFFAPARVRPYLTLGLDWVWTGARRRAGRP